MKKVRVILSAFAVVFALISAFGFANQGTVEDPAFIDTSSSPHVCTRVSEVCGGDDVICVKAIEGFGNQVLYDWDTTADCGPNLKMEL
jgi:hypothetical protein